MNGDFKVSMRHLAGAVNIVTAGTGAEASGLTATAVCSLSMAPPRLLVCLNRSGATCAALLAAHAFCVNVLGTDALALAETFAGRTGLSGAEKFASCGWIADEGHPPRLADAIAAIRCSVHSVQLVGTHAIVVGDVEAVWNRPDAQPLVYHDQSFRTLCALD